MQTKVQQISALKADKTVNDKSGTWKVACLAVKTAVLGLWYLRSLLVQVNGFVTLCSQLLGGFVGFLVVDGVG